MRAAVASGLILTAALVHAAGAPIPPAPDHWVTDQVGFLSAPARGRLDARLEAYQQQTGHQVVVWIGDTLDGAPLDDWAVRTFAAWKVGRKGLDDGIALFVLARDRTIDLEVGYGLEDRVPDAVARRIIGDVMTPRLRAGDHDGAVEAGVDAVLQAVGGTAGPPGKTGPSVPGMRVILYVLLGLIGLVVLVTHPRLAMFFLWTIASGGRGGAGFGGRSSGGGGFSGGGGRSGGGGARGSW